MAYLQKLRKYFKDDQYFEDEINTLKTVLQSKNYFKVIILAPQLMEKITTEIGEHCNEYIIRKMGEPKEDELEVQRLYNKLVQEESIKARVASYLVDFYVNDYFEFSLSKKEFVKFFTKLESIVSCRNNLSHEYYKKHISDQRIKRAANEAIEVTELLSYHPVLYY